LIVSPLLRNSGIEQGKRTIWYLLCTVKGELSVASFLVNYFSEVHFRTLMAVHTPTPCVLIAISITIFKITFLSELALYSKIASPNHPLL
jgi:hypothetical protein